MEENRLRWMVLLTVMVGTFLGRLDQTIVNLALPKIIDDYHITVSAAGWIATAYILANAVFVPIWGKLGDSIGRKKVYVIGFTMFIVGSVLAGFAWNLPSMILFRVIQAIAGSADYPTAMAILTVTFPPGKPRAQALGIWSASFAAAAVFGPLIGGPLIDNFNWRSVFLVNLPVGLIGLGMALAFVKESVSEKKTMIFDWWGAITLGVSLAALVLVLDKGLEWGWLSQKSFIAYGVTALFAVIFYWIEKRHPEPIIDFRYFKNRIFNLTLVNNFIVFMGMMGSIFLIPVFSQTFLGFNATESGYLFMPMAAAMMFAAPLGGRLIGKVKPSYVIAASTLIAGIGIAMYSWLDPRTTAFELMVPMFVMAFGMGFGMAQRTNIVASIFPENEIGIVSSILALARNIAGAFGISVFGTLLNSSIENHVLSIGQNSAIHSTNPYIYAQGVALVSLKAQITGYGTVFEAAALIVIIGAISALFIATDKNAGNKAVQVE